MNRVKRILSSTLFAAAMTAALFFSQSKSVSADPMFPGTTGDGTKDDPLIVDTFAELKSALQYSGTLYIQVDSFTTNTTQGGGSFYALTPGTDCYDEEPVISQKGTKYLQLNTTVDIRTNFLTSNISTLIEVGGFLTLSGDGILQGGLSGNTDNSILLVKSSGSLICDGPSVYVTQSVDKSATAIRVNYGDCTINKGKIWGKTSDLFYNTSSGYSYYGNAVFVKGGTLIINGGFLAVDTNGESDHGLDIGSGSTVQLNGGAYNGIRSEGKDISAYIKEGYSIFDIITGNTISGATKNINHNVMVSDEGPIIQSVNVNVTTPFAGMKYAEPSVASSNIDLDKYAWFEYVSDRQMDENELFEAGKQYKLMVTVNTKDAYSFKDDPGTDYVHFNTTLNGTVVSHDVGEITFCYVFTAETAKDLSGATIGVDDQTYTGLALEPPATVVLDGVSLSKDTDYTVAYSNNINAGKASVTITGKGKYMGTAAGTFTIKAADISSAVISGLSDKAYTGSAITQNIIVKLNAKELKPGTDYDVAYTDNTKVGTAKVTVKGKGNYTGTVTGTFAIKGSGTEITAPENVTLSKLRNKGKKTLVVSWKKAKADGFEVQIALKKNFKKGKKTKTAAKTKCKFKNLKKGKTYFVRVRAYNLDGDKKIYSKKWSAVKNIKITK